MKNILREKLGALIGIVLMVAGLLIFVAFNNDKDLRKEVVIQVTNTVTETVSDIIKYEMSAEEVENLPTTTIEEQTEEQEKATEQEVESEGFELQGEIAYEGDRANTWNIELGDYKGLTYYSQIDSRWKNKIYSSVGDSSQTIGSSGCGPTSAAMIVTTCKGAITPDTMSDLFVKYRLQVSKSRYILVSI